MEACKSDGCKSEKIKKPGTPGTHLNFIIGGLLVNIEKMTAEIDLMKNGTYIVTDGRLVLVDSPPKGFGKQVISWQAGKPSHFEINYTSKV